MLKQQQKDTARGGGHRQASRGRGAYAGRGKKKHTVYRRRAPDPDDADDEGLTSEDENDIDDDRDPDDYEDMINTPAKDLPPAVQAAKTMLMVSIDPKGEPQILTKYI